MTNGEQRGWHAPGGLEMVKRPAVEFDSEDFGCLRHLLAGEIQNVERVAARGMPYSGHERYLKQLKGCLTSVEDATDKWLGAAAESYRHISPRLDARPSRLDERP